MNVFVVLTVLLLREALFCRVPRDNNSSLTLYRMMSPLLSSLDRIGHEMLKVVLFTSEDNTLAGPPLGLYSGTSTVKEAFFPGCNVSALTSNQ